MRLTPRSHAPLTRHAPMHHQRNVFDPRESAPKVNRHSPRGSGSNSPRGSVRSSKDSPRGSRDTLDNGLATFCRRLGFGLQRTWWQQGPRKLWQANIFRPQIPLWVFKQC